MPRRIAVAVTLAGAAAMVTGVALINAPAALIFGGAGLVAAGLLVEFGDGS